jgi:hypothetical protein
MVFRSKAVTAPLKPLEDAVRNRSPVTLVFGAIIILGMIVLAVVLAAGGEDDLSGIELSGSAGSSACMVVAPDDVNVRGGPGYDYERVWILASGDTREALDGFEETWLRLEKGWVAVSEVTLQSSSACAQLPQTSELVLFDDDIRVPDAIEALEWHEILTENFATSINGWVESAGGAGAQISDGELWLSTAENTVSVFPADALSWGEMADGYITLRAEWSGAAGDDQQLALIFRADGPNFYDLTLSRNGDLSLWLDADGSHTLINRASISEGPLVLGLLFAGEEIRVFAGDEEHFSASDSGLSAGTYRLELRGENAAIRITRFEVKIPPAQLGDLLEP